ncbi:hypothetical protein [Flavobacterium sp. DSP2-3-1]
MVKRYFADIYSALAIRNEYSGSQKSYAYFTDVSDFPFKEEAFLSAWSR